MTERQTDFLRKAIDSLQAARILRTEGFHAIAASRAYYTMFYVAEAFLEGEGLHFSKHPAVVSAFGKHFARTGRVPIDLHRYLLDAEKARVQADYDARDLVTEDLSAQLIDHTRLFLETAERLIGPLPPVPHES